VATKLKNLRISKVDFVDEGANPDAHIKLTKSKGEKGQSTGENGDKNGFVSRLFGFIGKKAGMNQEEIDSAVEEVLKGNSVSFNERFNEIKNRKIADEIWDICYALQASLCSILNDEELDSTGAATAMNESLTKYVRNKQLGIKMPEDTDRIKYQSAIIHKATIAEDREKLWDNKKVWQALESKGFQIMSGLDVIEYTLKAGEKDRIIDAIDTLSGYESNIEEVAKN